MLERCEPVRPRSWITYRKCEPKLKRLHFQAKCPIFTISLNQHMLLIGASARSLANQDKENTFADDTIKVLLTQNLASCYLQLPVMPLIALGCNCVICDCCAIGWRHLCYSQATGGKLELLYDSKEHIEKGKNTMYRHFVPEILISMVCLVPVKERKEKKVVLITFACLRVKSKLRNKNSFKQKHSFMLAHFPPEGEVNHFCLKQTGMHLFMITNKKKKHHYLHHKLKTSLKKNLQKTQKAMIM